MKLPVLVLKWRGWEFQGGRKEGGGGGGGLESGNQRGSAHGAVLLAGCRRCGDVLTGVLQGRSRCPLSLCTRGPSELPLPCLALPGLCVPPAGT